MRFGAKCSGAILQFTLQIAMGKSTVLMACWWYFPAKMGFFIPWRFAGWPECSCREGQLAISWSSNFTPKNIPCIAKMFCFRCSLYLRHTHTPYFVPRKKCFVYSSNNKYIDQLELFLYSSLPPPTKKNGSKPYITTKHLRFNGVRDLHPGNLT